MKNIVQHFLPLSIFAVLLSCNGENIKDNNKNVSKVVNNSDNKVQDDNSKKAIKSDTIPSIKINDQIWTTKNLNVTTFRNGERIQEAKSDSDWVQAGRNGRPVWCYYNNDSVNGKKYGKLYNWFAVNDKRGLAPEGWHIPTEKEWNSLINYLGNSGSEKIKNKTGWEKDDNYKEGGSNSSGLSVLPSGFRYKDSTSEYFGFSGIGEECNFWSATSKDGRNAVSYSIYNDLSDIFHKDIYKGAGFSLRCISNKY